MKKILKRNQPLFFLHVILCAMAALIQVGVALVYRQITEVAMSGDVKRLLFILLHLIEHDERFYSKKK